MNTEVSEFIKRNLPIFVVAFLTVLVFVILIILSQRGEKNDTPTLNKVEKFPEELSTTNVENAPYVTDKESELEKLTEEFNERFFVEKAEEVDEIYGKLEIVYTDDEGFKPRKPAVYEHQVVKFINNTDRTIEIEQLTPLFEELTTNNITILPGDTYEKRMNIENAVKWAFRETSSKEYGAFFFQKPKYIDKKLRDN